jgi:hypothetical protein
LVCYCWDKVTLEGAAAVAKSTKKLRESFPRTVSAEPNKDFFVQMLTRDIDLGDAILDLLDNCVDGIVRSVRTLRGNKPYAHYHAKITLTPSLFSVEDNCGGIPLELAKTKAFHMGRPPGHSENIATVGMYGIGMKRAIFKIGQQCEVRSRSGKDVFEVEISKSWLGEPNNWDLPIRKLDPSEISREGTTIRITELRPEVARRFDESKDAFIRDFSTFVAQHYAIILGKGFRVSVNGRNITPSSFSLLSTELTGAKTKKGVLAPYLMEGVIDSVDVTVAVGFYRRIPSETEIEAEHEERASKDDAGWTIVCNDRVVIYRDRSRITGWGESGVPNYHGQFIAISGIVVLSSKDLWKLPLTTTKRGIDASSEIYSVVKDYMREGIKYFTRFTNRWKKLPDARDELYKSARLMSLDEIKGAIPDGMRSILKAASKGVDHGTRYTPDLPLPSTAEREVRISFSRPVAQVRTLAARIFDDPDAKPAEVGGACFDQTYKAT